MLVKTISCVVFIQSLLDAVKYTYILWLFNTQVPQSTSYHPKPDVNTSSQIYDRPPFLSLCRWSPYRPDLLPQRPRRLPITHCDLWHWRRDFDILCQVALQNTDYYQLYVDVPSLQIQSRGLNLPVAGDRKCINGKCLLLRNIGRVASFWPVKSSLCLILSANL